MSAIFWVIFKSRHVLRFCLLVESKKMCALAFFFFTQAPKVFIDEKRIHKKKVATSQTETCLPRLYLNTT